MDNDLFRILSLIALVPGILLSKAKLQSIKLENIKKELEILSFLGEESIFYKHIKEGTNKRLSIYYGVIGLSKEDETKEKVPQQYNYSRWELFVNWFVILGGVIGFVFWTYWHVSNGSWWGIATGIMAFVFLMIAMNGPDEKL